MNARTWGRGRLQGAPNASPKRSEQSFGTATTPTLTLAPGPEIHQLVALTSDLHERSQLLFAVARGDQLPVNGRLKLTLGGFALQREHQ